MSLVIAARLGFVTGFRTFTPLAVFSGAAMLGHLGLEGSGFAWLASVWTFAILAGLAILELLGDKSPRAPKRTSAPALGGRLLAGAVIGAAAGAVGDAVVAGAVLGAVAALAGAHAGMEVRTRLAGPLQGNRNAGLVEDLITLLAALALVSAL